MQFIYLPLMYAASLFGMNVNVFQNNPDWRWYILFSVAFLFFTLGLWVVSDPDFKLRSFLSGKAHLFIQGKWHDFLWRYEKNYRDEASEKAAPSIRTKARLDEQASSNC
ncbi:hypothetical protein N7513_000851 [Penicillium frequentans]|nr:hypothetical protein N7513_000851 [Penicillium glabrum]